MRYIGYFAGVVAIALTVLVTSTSQVTLAECGVCGSEKAHAGAQETKCVVCGMSTNTEKGVTVKFEGKSITLCSESCAEAFKKDPCKYCDDEKCAKRKTHEHEHKH